MTFEQRCLDQYDFVEWTWGTYGQKDVTGQNVSSVKKEGQLCPDILSVALNTIVIHFQDFVLVNIYIRFWNI